MDPRNVRDIRMNSINSVVFVIVAFRNPVDHLLQLSGALTKAARDVGYEARVNLVVNDGTVVPSSNDVRVVDGHGNIGFAAGVAEGVRCSIEDYIVVVNPDCGIDYEEFRTFMEEVRPDRGILMPMLHTLNGSFDYMPYENWTYSIGRKVSELLCRRLERRSGSTIPRYAKLSGAFLGMERATAFELDLPFDRSYFLYAEDRDMTDRARRIGVPLVLLRDVKITHAGGESGRTVSELVEKCKADGSLRVAYRRYGRLGAALYDADLCLVDIAKRAFGKPSAVAAHRWSATRWRNAGYCDPGPLTEEILREKQMA